MRTRRKLELRASFLWRLRTPASSVQSADVSGLMQLSVWICREWPLFYFSLNTTVRFFSRKTFRRSAMNNQVSEVSCNNCKCSLHSHWNQKQKLILTHFLLFKRSTKTLRASCVKVWIILRTTECVQRIEWTKRRCEKLRLTLMRWSTLNRTFNIFLLVLCF